MRFFLLHKLFAAKFFELYETHFVLSYIYFFLYRRSSWITIAVMLEKVENCIALTFLYHLYYVISMNLWRLCT